VVVYHHRSADYTGPHRALVDTVVVADYFADVMEIGFSGNRFPTPPSPELYRSLGITWSQVEDLETVVRQEIERAKVFLKLS